MFQKGRAVVSGGSQAECQEEAVVDSLAPSLTSEARERGSRKWVRKIDVAGLCKSVGGGELFLAQRDRGEAPGCII